MRCDFEVLDYRGELRNLLGNDARARGRLLQCAFVSDTRKSCVGKKSSLAWGALSIERAQTGADLDEQVAEKHHCGAG